MPKFTGETDKPLKVKLTSTLLGARWASDHVSQSGVIPLEVQTQFVADGSAIKITIKDAEGKTVEALNGKVHSNVYRIPYAATKPNKTGGMYFEAELPDHGLKGVSGRVAVLPPTRVTEPKWLDAEKKEPETLHPGERYVLQAKVDAIPGKTDVVFNIHFLEKPDAEPVLFRTLDTKVKDGKAEVHWEIPPEFRLPPAPADRPSGSAPEDAEPAFRFDVTYVGATAASPSVPYVPSKYMTVLEVEDALFHHDSAVFLPSAPLGPSSADGGPAPQDASRASSGLGIVASLFRQVDAHPDKKLVIAGHADTSGDVAYNFTLSGKRAEAVLAVIENDKEKWATTCQGQQKVQDYQQILSHYHDLLGWECDPQGVDGILGDNTRKALKGFRTRYNADKNTLGFGASPDLPEAALAGDKLKAEYWKAVFDLYQWELAQGLGLGTDIPGLSAFRGKVQFVDGGKKFLACGESFPIQQPERGDFRSQTNRRIEFLLFDPGEEPALNCPAARGTVHTKDECPVYGLRRYLRRFIAPLWLLRFRIVDEDDDPVEVQRPLKYEVKDREGRTVQSGTFTGGTQVLLFGDPLEKYTIFIEGVEAGPLIDVGNAPEDGAADPAPVTNLRLQPGTWAARHNILASLDAADGQAVEPGSGLGLGGRRVTSFWASPEGRIFFTPPDGLAGNVDTIGLDGASPGQALEIPARIAGDAQAALESYAAQFELLGAAINQRIEAGRQAGEPGEKLKFLADLAYAKALRALEKALDDMEAGGAAPSGDPGPAIASVVQKAGDQWNSVQSNLTSLA